MTSTGTPRLPLEGSEMREGMEEESGGEKIKVGKDRKKGWMKRMIIGMVRRGLRYAFKLLPPCMRALSP